MANITVITMDDTGYDTVAVLNANFAALNAELGHKYAATLTSAIGVTTVTHGLGSTDVIVSLYAAGKQVFADVDVISADEVKLTFEQAFTGRVVVLS